MEARFNGGQLRLARHYWGATLQEVADEVGKSRQFISQLESGKAKLDAGDSSLQRIADALFVETAFFFRPSRPQISEEQAHFRKLASTKASTRHAVLARGSIFDHLVEFIDERVRLPVIDFPDYSHATSSEDIERAAEKVRMHWGLGFGPVSHMVRVVERAGAVVAFFKGASTEVDALSIVGKRPVIVRNEAKKSPYRQRFDIAHELGHLVLHEGHVTGDRQTEGEANRFGSAFLMPRSTFLKAFPRRGGRIDWQGVRELKLAFQVSKAAILYRAKTLNILDDHQYRSAVITLKNRGEAVEEAEDRLLQREEGEVVSKSMEVLRNGHGIDFDQLAREFNVLPKFLDEILPADLDRSPAPRRPKLSVVKGVAGEA